MAKKRGLIWWEHPGLLRVIIGAVAVVAVLVALAILTPPCQGN